MLMIGAKGPSIMFFAAIFLWLAVRSGGLPLRLVLPANAAMMGAYALAGLVLGIKARDYHVLGLLGGLRGFLFNPLGHGFGVGGNLGARESLNWQEFQNAGIADYGLESTVGVALYQWGVCGLLFLGFYVFIWRTWLKLEIARPEADKTNLLLPLAMGFLLINMVFQEEAMVPYALGFMAFMASVRLVSVKEPEHGNSKG
jgi:hypothetical protein